MKRWALWGTLVFLTLQAVSWTLTLGKSTVQGILSQMRFPAAEMEFLQGIPGEGVHLIPFVGVPLLVSIGLALYCRRYFATKR